MSRRTEIDRLWQVLVALVMGSALRGTGIVRPAFWERARYYNLERELAEALDVLQS